MSHYKLILDRYLEKKLHNWNLNKYLKYFKTFWCIKIIFFNQRFFVVKKSSACYLYKNLDLICNLLFILLWLKGFRLKWILLARNCEPCKLLTIASNSKTIAHNLRIVARNSAQLRAIPRNRIAIGNPNGAEIEIKKSNEISSSK